MMVYNTLERKVVEFAPLNDENVKIFVCGQTVYDDAHIGHAKTYIDFDIIVRWLRFSGYRVKYIQNITDIDDKIINRANEKGISAKELSEYYEKRLMEDMQAMDVKESVDMFPRSHDYIDQIRDQIQLLLDKGYAYYLDRDIYYDVDKFKSYTELSGMSLKELNEHRIEPKDGKRNAYDFALWKASKGGEPSWSISLNINDKETKLDGRPGWHIEDTAITFAIFGPRYDIHGGAKELIFPHHTNEIAQAEAAFGETPFVKYWLHSGVLNIKGAKMSKSLKNFITIRELLETYSPEALRVLIASTHYRKEVMYTEKLINDATIKINSIYASLTLFYNHKETTVMEPEAETLKTCIDEFESGFKESMDNDFDTPKVLNSLIVLVNEIRLFVNSGIPVQKSVKEQALKKISELSHTIGILKGDLYANPLPKDAEELIMTRESHRKQNRFGDADLVRKKLREEFNISLEDSKNGPIWYWMAPKTKTRKD